MAGKFIDSISFVLESIGNVSNEEDKEADNYCEECYTFYKGCRQNHVGKHFTGNLRLTGYGLIGSSTNLSDSKTRANGCYTGTKSST